MIRRKSGTKAVAGVLTAEAAGQLRAGPARKPKRGRRRTTEDASTRELVSLLSDHFREYDQP